MVNIGVICNDSANICHYKFYLKDVNQLRQQFFVLIFQVQNF